jgi:triacylglycerol lipase
MTARRPGSTTPGAGGGRGRGAQTKTPSRRAAGSRGAALAAARAILEASVGDGLHAQGLASTMGVVRHGRRVPLSRPALRRAFRRPTGRVAIWVHGLGVTERIWTFPRYVRKSYGTLLESEAGLTPVFIRYNTGRHIAESGAALDQLIEALVQAWPVPINELVLVGYSMGGLVIRSACHQGAERSAEWVSRVRHALYLGVPHLGVPMERAGRVLTSLLRSSPNRVVRAIGTFADFRSAGVKDLGDGRLDASGAWLPLLPGCEHHVLVGTLHAKERHLLSLLLGDGIVPISSARARRRGLAPGFAETNVTTVGGIGHVALPRSPRVYATVRTLLIGRC